MAKKKSRSKAGKAKVGEKEAILRSRRDGDANNNEVVLDTLTAGGGIGNREDQVQPKSKDQEKEEGENGKIGKDDFPKEDRAEHEESVSAVVEVCSKEEDDIEKKNVIMLYVY